MPTSDIWLPLLIAVLGLAGTISGVVITQRRSDRREDARWVREREREREQRIREDAARIFNHRRDAYVDYLAEATAKFDAQSKWEAERGKATPPEHALETLWHHLTSVKVYGTPEATRIAEALYQWLYTEHFGSSSKTADHAGGFDRLTDEFVQQMRTDLGIDSS